MNKELDEILEELIKHTDNVRAEFSYTDDIHRNEDLQIAFARESLLLWHDREKRKWAGECVGEDEPCSTPVVLPREYVTHDMAVDAESREMEGQIYREETIERCGGCVECIKSIAKAEIRARLERG